MADPGPTRKPHMAEHTTHIYSDVYNQSPREALDALGHAFGRIGRAIDCGGRRMQRLAEQERLRTLGRLRRPDVEGRRSRKGSFKLVIRALRSIGTPNENGVYQKESKAERKRREDSRRVTYPHVRASRAERRLAEMAASKAGRAGASVPNHPSEPWPAGPDTNVTV